MARKRSKPSLPAARVDLTVTAVVVARDGKALPPIPPAGMERLTATQYVEDRREEFEATGNPIALWHALAALDAVDLRVPPWLRRALMADWAAFCDGPRP